MLARMSEAKKAYDELKDKESTSGEVPGIKFKWQKQGKYLIRQSQYWLPIDLDDHTDYSSVVVAVYPKPEHLEKFHELSHDTKHGGPATMHPGSIGSAVIHLMQNTKTKKYTANLRYAQAHYKLSPTENSAKDKETSKFVRQYGGWRQRAIEHLLQTCREKNANLKINKRDLGEGNKKLEFTREIHAAAKLQNFQINEHEYHLELTPTVP